MSNIPFKIEANTKYFKRIIVKQELKIDFINDLTPHFGSLETINGILIDNKENILSNKLTTIISRTEIRDVYDIFVLLKNNHFEKSKIIEKFREKTSDELDLVYSMLRSFPIKALSFKDIDFVNQDRYNEFIIDYPAIVNSFIHEDKPSHKLIKSLSKEGNRDDKTTLLNSQLSKKSKQQSKRRR